MYIYILTGKVTLTQTFVGRFFDWTWLGHIWLYSQQASWFFLFAGRLRYAMMIATNWGTAPIWRPRWPNEPHHSLKITILIRKIDEHMMIWLVVWNMIFKYIFMTFHILGMSSFQLTNSIILQRGRSTTNQYDHISHH